MGPFKIIKKVMTSSYKFDLLTSMKIHNTFHISLLEPYEDNKFPSQIQTPPPVLPNNNRLNFLIQITISTSSII